LVLMGLVLSSTRRWYCRQKEEAAVPQEELSGGDAVVESLRTGGDDPRYRSSLYWAIGLWASVLVLPVLIRGCGWEKGYGLPPGEGGDVEIVIEPVIKPQKRPEKKFIINAWSPYIFERAKIDDSLVVALAQDAMDTYAVTDQSPTGKPGAGGGKGGGWPTGMEGALVRFIRLQYGGGNWDQAMGRGGDYNMLIKFNQVTGFPIARETESREVGRLKMFPKRKAPPFVYMTGSGNINLTENEVKVLRWYLEEEGGMLIISHGGGRTFGPSVRRMLNRVLPGRSLVDISNDDPIFQRPFVFPNGAPELWHHDGYRASGIKVNGRWVVFYHPGDLGDAWKDGHSGAGPEVAERAYKLGINLMYYAFNAYYRRHFAPGEEMSK